MSRARERTTGRMPSGISLLAGKVEDDRFRNPTPCERKFRLFPESRQKRIREIQDLFDTGLKVSEISKLYGISERQVREDRKDGRALDRALSKAVDQAELLGREIRGYEQALRMEWRPIERRPTLL